MYLKKHGDRFLPIILLITFFTGSTAFSQSFLSASGIKIVDTSGTEILLKGVNLGGWVLQEGWMISSDGNNPGTQAEMKKILYDQGQTDAQVETYYQSWRDNYITNADIDFIAYKGMNCVRFPMHYELFLTSAQRAVRNSVIHDKTKYTDYKTQLANWVKSNTIATDYSNEGYRLIDRLLNWCSAHKMYVILDMHAVPGSQGTDEHIADCISTPNDLWLSTVNQDVLNAIWRNISSRYKNNSTIAMYDLINEPNNTNSLSMKPVFQRLITTIRENGDNHLLMIEGNAWGNNYANIQPDQFTPRTGLVYNIHRYKTSNSTETTMSDPDQIQELGNAQKFRNTYQVPIFCGETGLDNNLWIKENIAALNSINIGYCIWSYKWHTDWNGWGFGRIPGEYPSVGTSAIASVLENIKFSNMVQNTNPEYWEAFNVPPVQNVPVNNVSVSPKTSSLSNNKSLQLIVTINPSNATNKSVTWVSSNTSVANVSSSGLVTGVSKGTTNITVTTVDGNKTATCIISVTEDSTSTIPFKIEAENYSDMKGVQKGSCSDTGDGQYVGWTDANDWMYYGNIKIPSSGRYTIEYRIASASDTGKLKFESGGGGFTYDSIDIPNTGDWQNWKTIKHTITLSAGMQNFGIVVIKGGFNINWWAFTPESKNGVFPDNGVSKSDFSDAKLFFYNPISEFLIIRQNMNSKINNIEIFSLSGKMIFKQQIGISSETNVNVNGFKPGAYMVKFYCSKEIVHSRFVKN